MGDAEAGILAALDQAPTSVAVLGGAELRYVYFNDQYRRYSPGTRVGDVFGKQTAQAVRFRELVEQVVRSGQQVHLREVEVELSAGGHVYLDLLIHPLKEGGVILIGSDVTATVE